MFGYGEEYHMMGGFGWVFIILIIGLLFYLFSKRSETTSRKSAKDILDERYAKGEINLEEYNEKKKNLED